MSYQKIDYTKINENKKFCNKELVEELTEELGISEYVIKGVIASNSNFLRRVIETGAYESIHLPYFGKLKAKHRSIQKALSNIKRG